MKLQCLPSLIISHLALKFSLNLICLDCYIIWINLMCLQVDGTTPAKDSSSEIKEHSEDGARASIAVGAAMMLLGLLMGFIWAWLRFFRRGKSPRGGMTSNSGQVGLSSHKLLVDRVDWITFLFSLAINLNVYYIKTFESIVKKYKVNKILTSTKTKKDQSYIMYLLYMLLYFSFIAVFASIPPFFF